ncbi:MAG: DUF4112 domain-containing protein [Alteromonas sp.]|nr:DUF4112 domain-containing protein [Alteromonas sp.]
MDYTPTPHATADVPSGKADAFLDYIEKELIPFVGDVADIFYKANQKNVRIMERWWIFENKANVDKATQQALEQWKSQSNGA